MQRSEEQGIGDNKYLFSIGLLFFKSVRMSFSHESKERTISTKSKRGIQIFALTVFFSPRSTSYQILTAVPLVLDHIMRKSQTLPVFSFSYTLIKIQLFECVFREICMPKKCELIWYCVASHLSFTPSSQKSPLNIQRTSPPFSQIKKHLTSSQPMWSFCH